MTFPRVPLGLITPVVGGGTPSSDSRHWDGKIPFITPVDLNARHGGLIETSIRSITPEGLSAGSRSIDSGVIVSCRAPIGSVGRVQQPSAFNQGCKGLPIASKDDSRFLAYVFSVSKPELEALGNGTTFGEISGTALQRWRLPWPGLAARSRIADYLDAETAEMDSMVAQLEGLAGTLWERRQAVVTKSLRGDIHRPSVPLGLIAPIIGGGTPSSDSENWGDDIPFVTPVDLNSGSLAIAGTKRALTAQGLRVGSKSIQSGVIVSCRAPVGSVGYVDHLVAFNQGCKGIPMEDSRDSVFLCYALGAAREELESRSNGTTFLEISGAALSQWRVAWPEREERHQIVALLDAETAKIDAMIADAIKLKELIVERRSALITDVVTGRKQV